jgi:acetyl esterase/lipase
MVSRRFRLLTLFLFGIPAQAAVNANLDIQVPLGPGPFPAILAVHGGGWTSGSRADADPFCRLMVQSGFACAALDYRLAPQTRFPGQIEDLTNAIRELLQKAPQYHLDTRGLLLAGESAGGQLVAFLGAQHPAGLPILGVVAFSPPLDLEALAEPVRALGILPPEIQALTGATGWTADDLDRMRRASPLRALQPGSPPFLIVFGTADLLVPSSQARIFCQRASACELLPIPGARHGLWSEEQFDRWESVWYTTLVNWIRYRYPR